MTPNFLLININSLTGNMNLFILTNFFWERTSNFQSQHKVMERAWTNFICIIKQIVILLFASWPGITIFRTIYITQLPLQQHTSSSSPDLPQLILPGSKTWPRSYKWYQFCHAGLGFFGQQRAVENNMSSRCWLSWVQVFPLWISGRTILLICQL